MCGFKIIVYQSYQNLYRAWQDFVPFVNVIFKRHIDKMHYLIIIDVDFHIW